MIDTIVDLMLSPVISPAYAEAAAPRNTGMIDFIPLIILFVVMYFLMIRPQQKRAKEHRELIGAIKKGDEVVTSGGLLGKISNVGDNFVTLDMGKGTELKVQRQAVSSVMPKGTVKEN